MQPNTAHTPQDYVPSVLRIWNILGNDESFYLADTLDSSLFIYLRIANLLPRSTQQLKTDIIEYKITRKSYEHKRNRR